MLFPRGGGEAEEKESNPSTCMMMTLYMTSFRSGSCRKSSAPPFLCPEKSKVEVNLLRPADDRRRVLLLLGFDVAIAGHLLVRS